MIRSEWYASEHIKPAESFKFGATSLTPAPKRNRVPAVRVPFLFRILRIERV